MQDYLKAQIATRERKVEEIRGKISLEEQEVAVLLAEVRAYRDALAQIRPGQESSAVREGRMIQRVVARTGENRGISDTWRDLFGVVAMNMPDDTPLERIYHSAELLGHTIRPDSIRSQIAGKVQQGLLIRTTPGRFTISAAGLDRAGITDEFKNDLLARLARKEKALVAQQQGL
jgi:hypothetical protein